MQLQIGTHYVNMPMIFIAVKMTIQMKNCIAQNIDCRHTLETSLLSKNKKANVYP